MREPLVAGFPVPLERAPAVTPIRGRGWDAYLLAAIALVPVVVPAGPAQTAFVDLLDVLALVAFAWALLVHRPALHVPFALPATLIAAGSLLALTNAASPGAASLAMAQDLYLYLWFVAIVNLWTARGTLDRFRIAWVGVACVVTLIGLAIAAGSGAWSPARLLAARGLRWSSTFYNPNMFADYLVLSVFVLLSLERHISRATLTLGAAVLALGLLLTKSNGGLCALAVGLAVWAPARAAALGAPPVRLVGAALLLLGLLVAGAWAHAEWHWGEQTLGRLTAETFAGRASRSSERRERIWAQLVESAERQPLGIGPANSSEVALAIGARERPGSLRSKEAHSDYVAAFVERGLLGFLGLALAVVESFRRIGAGWREAALRGGTRLVLAALLGGLVASTVHSMVIEKLHFRHFWMFLALAMAIPAERRP